MGAFGYNLITTNADIIKGIFCGDLHSDFYTEVKATYKNEKGEIINILIPQYLLTANVYDKNAGHVIKITVR